MAEESYPRPGHNARAVTDIEYEKLASRFSDDGVYGDPTDAPVVTAGTGLSVNIRADVAASLRGHGWYSGTDAFSVGVSGNIASQPRIDWVVLRLDRSDWTVKAAIVGGTAGSGAPALTQETGDTGLYEIPLAQVRILGGASSVTVTRAEQYVGTRCRPCTSTTRNPTPRIGELGFETDTGRLILWTGSTWLSVHQEATAVVNAPLTSGWKLDGTSLLDRRGNTVSVRTAYFERTTNIVAPAATRLPILIPAAHLSGQYQYSPVYLSGSTIGRLTIYPQGDARAGQIWMLQHPAMLKGDRVHATTLTWVV